MTGARIVHDTLEQEGWRTVCLAGARPCSADCRGLRTITWDSGREGGFRPVIAYSRKLAALRFSGGLSGDRFELPSDLSELDRGPGVGLIPKDGEYEQRFNRH